jgi:putative tricarboxylic transport membrane protein
MFNGDVISGLISILFSLLFIIPALGFDNRTTDGSPGAGFFPIVVGGGLLLMGVILAVSGLKTKKRYFTINDEMKKNLKLFFLTLVIILAYFILWKLIPFVIATFLFLAALNYIYQRSLKFNLSFSFTVSLLIYLIFGKIFHVMFNL